MNTMQRTVGDVLREWRQRRRLSQLDLASEAEISARHLSFVETGRANPSRELLLHLADQLDVPLRERNALLLAGGYAPVYAQRSLDDPSLTAAREAVTLILRCHEPNPALAIDRHWNLIAMNRTVEALLVGAATSLLEPPVNVLRLSMHPDGLASRIVNINEFGAYLSERLRHEIGVSGDPVLADLLVEIGRYRAGPGRTPETLTSSMGGIAIPFQLRAADGSGAVLSFFSTTTVFGTATDVTLSELAIESFFPADPSTAEAVRRLAACANETNSRETTGNG